jgi:hypothetical protein
METSDPMPKDKRTVAYKEWRMRESHRQRMLILDGAISVRGFNYSNLKGNDENQKFSDLSINLATLRANLIENNPSSISVPFIDDSIILSDRGGRSTTNIISLPEGYVNKFISWAMINQYTDIYSSTYPAFTAKQYELFSQGKEVPTTIKGYNGLPQPAHTEYGLGRRGEQCNWRVVGNNEFTRAPDSRGGRREDKHNWAGATDRVNRWQPLVSGISDSYGRGNLGLFPPTFWPKELGAVPDTQDEILEKMIIWIEGLIETFWSTPRYGNSSYAVHEWQQVDYRLSKYNPQNTSTAPRTTVTTWHELQADTKASAWLDEQSLGILVGLLRQMCLANSFYELVYDEKLSKSNEWVVLSEPSRQGGEENYPRGPNLVMPLATWIDKATAHENWNVVSSYRKEGYNNPLITVTREDLLRDGISAISADKYLESNESEWYEGGRRRPIRRGPTYSGYSKDRGLGLLTLAMSETVSFNNLISPVVFESGLEQFTKFWRASQTERVSTLQQENQEKITAVDSMLKTLNKEVDDAEVNCYVQFTQTKGPRGGLYDGFTSNFTMQLQPVINFQHIAVITEQQQQELNQIYVKIYRKFTDAKIPQDPSEVIFKLGGKTISYAEAMNVKNEDRSYGSSRKYPSLERAMSGFSFAEMFTIRQESQLTSLPNQFYGMTADDKSVLSRIVPNTVNQVRTERQVETLTKKLVSALYKVNQAKSALIRQESSLTRLSSTLTKEQQDLMVDNYLKSLERGSRKSGEPTPDLLKAIGIPIPKKE